MLHFLNPIYDMVLLIGGAVAKYHLKPLRVLQNKALRYISGAGYDADMDKVLENLSLLSLENLYKISDSNYVYKNKSHFGVKLKCRLGLRGGDVAAELPKWTKVHSTMQARYAAAMQYNKIPEFLQQCIEFKKFNRDLKNFLLRNNI